MMLVLATATITGAAVYSYQEIHYELTEVALSRREAVAELMAGTLAEKFGRSVDVGISLSTRVQFKKLVAAKKWDQASRILLGVPSDFPYIERLFITDAAGTLKADVPALPGVRGINFATRDWYKGVSRNWRPYVSAVYTRAAIPPLSVFAVAVPIKSMSGQVAGILVLQIRMENLLQWVAGINQEAETSIYVVDSKGQMILRSRHGDQSAIVSIRTTPLVQKLREGKEAGKIGFDEVSGEESIINYAEVPEYHWGVVVMQPVRSSKVLAARNEQLRLLLTGYGFILLLGVITAILLLRIFSARQVKADLEMRVAERTAELAAVNKELEAFSYSVSHDLRAPLRSIDGFSQALLEDYAERLDDQARDYLNRVRAATQRMGLLIDDMLTLSRVTRAEMQRGTVDLSLLAEDVLEELQKTEPGRKVEWRIEPGLAAEGDTQLLRVALLNLLGNAWKYTARQPQPRIEFGAVRNADGTREFFVRDNGAGFDMRYAGKLFGAFQRLHTASEFPGTGIGLATVQRIINRHRGQVRAEGVPGRGATFYFTLPD